MNKILVVHVECCRDDFENPDALFLLFTEEQLKEYIALINKGKDSELTEEEEFRLYEGLRADYELSAAEFKNFGRIVKIVSYYGSYVKHEIEDYCTIDHPIATAGC